MSKPRSFLESLEPRRLLATYTVDNLGDVDDGNYDPGQTTLREAISQANSNPDGDSIQFDGALSGGTIALGGSHLYIADDLAITGLGQDFLTVSGNSASRIFWVESGVAVGIFGLTIRNGAADSGAGIYNSGTLTLTGSTIADNVASTTAGGIFNNGEMTLTDSNVWFNVGSAYAGGIRNEGVLTVEQSVISANRARSGGGIGNTSSGTLTITRSFVYANNADHIAFGGIAGYGGGIASEGVLTLTNTQVYTNTSSGDAGGIENRGTGVVTLTDSSVTSNIATFNAGGISNLVGTSMTLTNSTVSGNTAWSMGGIRNDGTLSLTDTTVSGNTATNVAGGGISNTGTLTILSSTISGNAADTIGSGFGTGGGIYNTDAGTVTITNSTISGNTAVFGGGIYDNTRNAGIVALYVYNSTVAFNAGKGIEYAESATTQIVSTIVSNNAGGDLVGFAGAQVTGFSAHNLIGDAASAGGLTHGVQNNIVGQNPLLLGLADNGGPTQTHGILGPGSPVTGAGSNPQALTTDQRGGLFARGTAVDIGAYQRQALALEVSTNWDAEDGDYSAGQLSLREALTFANGNPLGDTITFRNTLNNKVIKLRDGQLVLRGELTIDGLGATLLSISGENTSRVIFVESGADVRIIGLTITGGNFSSEGGGIYNAGSLSLRYSTVSGNASTVNGGGVLNAGIMSLAYSTLSGNSTQYYGGGISNTSAGTLSVTNSTISGNTSSFGSGIAAEGALTIRLSTIAFNSGAGLLLRTGSSTEMQSTIVSDNGGGDITSEGPSLSAGSTHNLVRDASNNGGLVNGASNNIVGADPLLAPLALNGGSTQTHAPGVGSPVIGAGTDLLFLDYDQRGIGFARTRGGAVDIGSFERGATPTIVSLGVSSAAVNRGGSVTLTANNVFDADGDITKVAFWLDNGNGTLGAEDTLIGEDTDGAGGYKLVYNVPGDATTGARKLFAVVWDADNSQSASVQAALTINFGVAPEIGWLSTSSATVLPGGSVTLTANAAADSDGDLQRVAFWLDNGNGTLGAEDTLLSEDTIATDGYKAVYTAVGSAAVGTLKMFAVAWDSAGLQSGAVSTTVRVLTAGGVPSGTADATDTQRVVRVNDDGQVIVFHEGWGYENLNQRTGAPAAIGDAVIWVDPKDGLTYVAAPSALGLVLFTRSAGGAWTSRNLSTETSASNSPVSNLTRLTTITDQIVIIAGIAADGTLVAFQQTLAPAPGGGPAFKFVDISADLTARGQSTPQFVRGMISYVPSWDTWHLAGIDTSGNIQSVWINPRKFTSWRTDNLSAITGAAALSGQLTVTLTSWNAINLTGLNTEGEVVTTWWIPRFVGNWANNNLTEEYTGSTLTGGNITGFVTPWGSMNYVGINATGQVTVYWWTPVQKWVVSLLVPVTTPPGLVPTGALTSAATSGGTLNVYGNNSLGDILRISWPKPAGAGWNIENLTAIAVPM